MSTKTFRPCPFCGTSDIGVADSGFLMQCNQCCAEGPCPSEDHAENISAWNRRAVSAQGDSEALYATPTSTAPMGGDEPVAWFAFGDSNGPVFVDDDGELDDDDDEPENPMAARSAIRALNQKRAAQPASDAKGLPNDQGGGAT